MSTSTPTGPLRTIDYCCADLNIGRTKVYGFIHTRDLIAVKLGVGTRITDESLQAFKKAPPRAV
jgi:excisionase family DNA binding protein